MRRRARWSAVLVLLGSLSACSGGDDQPAPGPELQAMDIASTALTEAGATPLGAAVGGDGQSESSVSTTLPWAATVGVFAACTGGGSVGLDLAGTALELDCDGQGHQLDDLVLPDDELPVFRVTEPSDEPSTWGLAFAQL